MLPSIPPSVPVSSREHPNLPLSAKFVAENETWLHAALEPFAQHEGDWDVLLTVPLVDMPEEEEAAEALRLEFETLLTRWGWARGIGIRRWLRSDWEGGDWLIRAVSPPHQRLCTDVVSAIQNGLEGAGVDFACEVLLDVQPFGLPRTIRPDILISARPVNGMEEAVGAVEVARLQNTQSLDERKALLFRAIPTLQHLLIFDIEYDDQTCSGTSDRPLRPDELVVSIEVSSFERTDNAPFYRRAPLPAPFTYSYPSSAAADIPPVHVPLAAFTTLDALLPHYAKPSFQQTVRRYSAADFSSATVTLSSAQLDDIFRRVGRNCIRWKTGWAAPEDHGRASTPPAPAPAACPS
ncbi:hypothetical protein JCM10213_008186 [Rhodosporidiobolus nylandii]